MISARELRIGNWIEQEASIMNAYNSHPIEVTPITLRQIAALANQEAVNLSPISLTAEVLRKINTTACANGSRFQIKFTYGYIEIGIAENGKARVYLEVGTHCEEPILLPHIQSLHELQNLYYSLEGQELEFKTVSTDS